MMHGSRTRTSRLLSAPDSTSTQPWYNNRINRRRSESAVPPLPASQVFSIPPSRPGRTLRKSSIDHHPSTSYGDPINYKVEGSTRLLFQNMKGLTHTTTHEDYKYYMQCIQGLSVDVMGLSETNTCWSHHHLSSDFRSAVHKFYRQSKVAFGAVSPSIDNCLHSETFQSGGSLTAVLGSFTSRIEGSNFCDATGLGRWSGITLGGHDSKKLSIMTAYRVCKGSPQTSSLGSSFLREYEYFRETLHSPINPRQQFLSDLQSTILSLQDAGHSTILILDANSTLDENDLADFVAACGLNDLHLSDSPTSTYIGAADRRIDFIFGCDEALKYVLRAGTLAYTEGPQSDHSSLFVDLSPVLIVPPPWSQINPSVLSRALHTGNPELVEKYHASMLKYYDDHRMVERTDALYQQRHTMSREEIRRALIKWDHEQGRAMEHSERLRRPPHKCSWSPSPRNSAILRRYWLLRLHELQHGSDYSATFHRWQRQI